MRMPAPSPLSSSLPVAPRWARCSRALTARSTRPWDGRPCRSATKATPQASCSNRGSYSPESGARVTRRCRVAGGAGTDRAGAVPSSGAGATVVIGSLQVGLWISPRGTTLALAWSVKCTRSSQRPPAAGGSHGAGADRVRPCPPGRSMAPMGPTDRRDAVVVGGGIIGLAVAWAAAGAGTRGHRRRPDARAGRHMGGGRHARTGGRGTLRRGGAGRPQSGRRAGLARVRRPARGRRRASPCTSGPTGRCWWPATRPTGPPPTGCSRFHRAIGLPATHLAARACREAEPLLAPGISGGADLPDDHQVDNRAAATALAGRLPGRRRGASWPTRSTVWRWRRAGAGGPSRRGRAARGRLGRRGGGQPVRRARWAARRTPVPRSVRCGA